MAENIQQTKTRNFSLDLIRVLACLLVVWQHTSEMYYIAPDGGVVREPSTYVIGIIDSIGRIAVPLFLMISGYFLLPMKDPFSTFFKKRMNRILIPFIVWCIAYAVYFVITRGDSFSQCLTNIVHIPVNYGTEVGYLWYVYMLIGIYLLIPVISPWIQSCTKGQLQVYIGIWLFTTFLPYIHLVFPEILGECFWNPTPLLYYFSGLAGYVLLGYYVKRYGAISIPWAIILFLVGDVLSTLIYNSRIETAPNIPSLELSWNYCSITVAMMTYGVFSLIQPIKSKGEGKGSALLTDIAVRSYAIYLGHIMVLNAVAPFFIHKLGSVAIEVPVIAIVTLIITYIIIRLLSFLPKAKWWLGI